MSSPGKKNSSTRLGSFHFSFTIFISCFFASQLGHPFDVESKPDSKVQQSKRRCFIEVRKKRWGGGRNLYLTFSLLYHSINPTLCSLIPTNLGEEQKVNKYLSRTNIHVFNASISREFLQKKMNRDCMPRISRQLPPLY